MRAQFLKQLNILSHLRQKVKKIILNYKEPVYIYMYWTVLF